MNRFLYFVLAQVATWHHWPESIWHQVLVMWQQWPDGHWDEGFWHEVYAFFKGQNHKDEVERLKMTLKRYRSFWETGWQWGLDQGVRFWMASEIPTQFFWGNQVPLFLTSWGDFSGLQNRFRLGVVGSRRAKCETLRWLDDALNFLWNHGLSVAIVSGGAIGVDKQAHMSAIKAHQPTVIWMPSGLAQLYPDFWSSLKDLVLAYGGVIVSLFWPFQPVLKSAFSVRNQWLIRMSQALLIPQAKMPSGSLMSARFAAEIGIPVITTPGLLWDAQFAGNILLMRDGAHVLLDVQELKDWISQS